MARKHQITIDGKSFRAESGELLLDAALRNGVELPFDCRAGHCGTCCVKLVSGKVLGGEGSEPGIVHACQCRVAGAAVIEKERTAEVRSIEGVLASLRPLSRDVVEIGVKTDRALLHHPGQYARIGFNGYPSRPYSITLPLSGQPAGNMVWFHIRRMERGRVSSSLGRRIRPGHRLTVIGAYGSAHFRPDCAGRIVLVGTSTGFAPIWAIAVAALRENPQRRMMVIAGGRELESLYMAPALVQLARFPNVLIVPVCSSLQASEGVIRHGRPTDYLPKLLPTDVLYACGSPGMVDAVKSIAAGVGAVCHSDPFLPANDNSAENGSVARAMERLVAPVRRRVQDFAFDRSGSLQG